MQKHNKENDTKLIYGNELKKKCKESDGRERGQTSSHQAYPEQLLAVNTTLMYCPFFLSDPWYLLHRDWVLILHFLHSGHGMPSHEKQTAKQMQWIRKMTQLMGHHLIVLKFWKINSARVQAISKRHFRKAPSAYNIHTYVEMI